MTALIIIVLYVRETFVPSLWVFYDCTPIANVLESDLLLWFVHLPRDELWLLSLVSLTFYNGAQKWLWNLISLLEMVFFGPKRTLTCRKNRLTSSWHDLVFLRGIKYCQLTELVDYHQQVVMSLLGFW